MKVNKIERVAPFDVDGTLIYYGERKDNSYVAQVYDTVTSNYISVNVNTAMVRLLKEEIQRGSHVIVWSRSGYEWAANVLRALDLAHLDIEVMTKPQVYFDDLPVDKWLLDRVFFEPGSIYKTT